MSVFKPRHTPRQHRLRNATRLHESNYLKLQIVIPGIRNIREKLSFHSEDRSELSIDVVEKSKYTTTFLLHLRQHEKQHWLPALEMKIRIYHDANVAEVLAFQDHHRLNARYEYPNARMYHRNEKWQLNHFLGDWLDYCLGRRCTFRDTIEPVDV